MVRRSHTAPIRGARVTGAVLALLACLLGHEVAYLVRFGAGPAYDTAMSRSGHDGYWLVFVTAVLASVVVIAAVAAAQLLRLQREAGTAPVMDEAGGIRTLVALTRRTWVRLAIAAMVIYTVQENTEAILAGGPLPGPGLLIGHDLPAALVVLASTLLVAAVVALVHWRRVVLLGRLASASATWPRPRARRSPVLDVRPVVAIRVACLGLRGPPRVGASSIQ